MGEIKPTGVFLTMRKKSVNGFDNEILAEYVRKIPGVRKVWITEDELDPRPELILKEISQNNLKRFVLAGYGPGLHKTAFSKAMTEAGLDPKDVKLASFSESGITDNEHAKAVLFCSIHDVPFAEARRNGSAKVLPETLVIGAGIAGIQAALEI
jgi:heterodisulfide reductase subunit A-like polyferredoxin